MKIVNHTTNKLFLASLALIVASVLFSCSDDAEDNPPLEGELSQTEVQTLLETEDITSSVDSALTELFNQSGNSSKGSSNDCYTAEYTDTGFTATFNNCVLNGTDNINGTLVVTYGSSDENNAEFTATYSDFFIGDIKVNGTRTYVVSGSESENSISFTVTSNITVELSDATTVSENGTKTFSIVFEEGQDTLWNLSGTWTIEKEGDTYAVEGNISKQFNCQYWTSGSLAIVKNGLAVDLDFGDGTCDNTATLTYPNGATQEIDL